VLVLSPLQNAIGAALLTNQVAAAAVTNLVGASFSAPPGSLRVGEVYLLRCAFTFLHTAAATPTLTVELVAGGVVVASAVLTPISVATTFSGWAEAYFTVRSIGASDTIMPAIHCQAQGLTQANDWGGGVVDVAADTVSDASALLFQLRMRMTTAVAGNTLTISQGWPERVVSP
jgi:hypothetical protein